MAALAWIVLKRDAGFAAEAARRPTQIGARAAWDVESRQEHSRTQAPVVQLTRAARSVRTVTQAGLPIVGARVHMRASTCWSCAGASDSHGAVVLPESSRVSEVVATAEGFETTRVVVDEDVWSEPLVIVLASGWRHCGTVTTSSGARPPPGVSVVAFPTDGELEVDVLGRWLDGDPSLLRAPVDAGGGFCLSGLRRGGLYSVFCSGAGYVMTYPAMRWLRQGSPPARLEVGRMFGALVVLEDEAGAPALWRGERLWEAWCSSASSANRGLAAHMAGLDIALAQTPDHCELLLFTSDAPEDVIGPLSLDYEIAGYERGHAQLDARAVALGVAQHKLALRATAAERGRINVRFARANGGLDLAADRELVRMGRLELVEVAELRGRPLRFPLRIDDNGRIGVDGVPVGAYSARYVSTMLEHAPRAEAGLPVNVTASEAELEISLVVYGAVRLDLRGADGTEYVGGVHIDISAGPPPAPDANGRLFSIVAGTGNFRPPLRIEGLAPGEYTISTDGPRFAGEHGRLLSAHVREGEETVLTARRTD